MDSSPPRAFDVPPPPPPPPRKTSPWIYVLIGCGGCVVIGIPLIAIVAAIAVPGLLSAQRSANERMAMVSLRVLHAAQADFRSNDRDLNGVQDFWTADIRGLYDLTPEKMPIALVELPVVMADGFPAQTPSVLRAKVIGARVPKAGYWFGAIREDGQGRPYNQKEGRHPHRFAFCAWPDKHGSGGKFTYIADESGILWKKDNGGRFVERWPADPSADGWLRTN